MEGLIEFRLLICTEGRCLIGLFHWHISCSCIWDGWLAVTLIAAKYFLVIHAHVYELLKVTIVILSDVFISRSLLIFVIIRQFSAFHNNSVALLLIVRNHPCTSQDHFRSIVTAPLLPFTCVANWTHLTHAFN